MVTRMRVTLIGDKCYDILHVIGLLVRVQDCYSD